MRLLISVLLTTLMGCAVYDENGRWGGYTHSRINERTYDITYEGNVTTSYEEAKRHIIKRAKEMGREMGFTHMHRVGFKEGDDAFLGTRNKDGWFIEFPGLSAPKYSIRVIYSHKRPTGRFLEEDVFYLGGEA